MDFLYDPAHVSEESVVLHPVILPPLFETISVSVRIFLWEEIVVCVHDEAKHSMEQESVLDQGDRVSRKILVEVGGGFIIL